MKYITEKQGGYDEWSDERIVIQSVVIDGKEYSRRIKGVFSDLDGNEITIEFPHEKAIGETITVERKTPMYQVWECDSLDEFKEITNIEDKQVDVACLEQKEF